ncbi:MAG: hypothetical protein HC897_16030 [Thermoanaerobaculia bacterium]|nr:hypothetical protein [Thermoanaerobaculia bacterium]
MVDLENDWSICPDDPSSGATHTLRGNVVVCTLDPVLRQPAELLDQQIDRRPTMGDAEPRSASLVIVCWQSSL